MLFFHEVHGSHAGEWVLLLYHSEFSDQWALYCPVQEASSGATMYFLPSTAMPEDFELVGSFFSRRSEAAGAAGPDLEDATEKGGIHVCLGSFTYNILRGVTVHVLYSELAGVPAQSVDPSDYLDYPVKKDDDGFYWAPCPSIKAHAELAAPFDKWKANLKLVVPMVKSPEVGDEDSDEVETE
jgi:hypothetical protein